MYRKFGYLAWLFVIIIIITNENMLLTEMEIMLVCHTLVYASLADIPFDFYCIICTNERW